MDNTFMRLETMKKLLCYNNLVSSYKDMIKHDTLISRLLLHFMGGYKPFLVAWDQCYF